VLFGHCLESVLQLVVPASLDCNHLLLFVELRVGLRGEPSGASQGDSGVDRYEFLQDFETLRGRMVVSKLTPVRFWPGRLKLDTRPMSTGLSPEMKSTGIVDVFAACADLIPPVAATTLTFLSTNSLARAASRFSSPFRPELLDFDITSAHVTLLVQTLAKSSNELCKWLWRLAV
jgi:hypothetical protein